MRKTKNLLDRLICLLVAFMMMSFYLFELESWGRYVLLVIALLVALLYALQNKGKYYLIYSESFHRYVAAFSFFCFISALWAWVPALSISKGITVFLILACFSLLYPYYRKSGSIDSLLESFLLSGYGICIYSFAYYGIDGIRNLLEYGIRLDNDFTNSNSLGMAASMSCIIQIHYLLKKEKRLISICMIPAILVIAVSQSRKAIIMLAIGVILVVLYSGRNLNTTRKLVRYLVYVALLIGLLCLLIKLGIFTGVGKRMESLLESMFGDGKKDIRTVFREIGWQQFLKTPILGIGMGNSLELLESAGQRRTYLHCNYVELLSSGGVVGFSCYYAMYAKLAWTLWKYRKYRRAETALCGILIILLLVMDYGMTSYYDKQQYLYLMCFFLQTEFLREDHLMSQNKKSWYRKIRGS